MANVHLKESSHGRDGLPAGAPHEAGPLRSEASSEEGLCSLSVVTLDPGNLALAKDMDSRCLFFKSYVRFIYIIFITQWRFQWENHGSLVTKCFWHLTKWRWLHDELTSLENPLPCIPKGKSSRMADPSQTTHLIASKWCRNVGRACHNYFAAQEKMNEYILLDTDHILHNRHIWCRIMYIFISNHISTRMNFKILTYPLVI